MGSGVHGALSLVQCTVADNWVGNSWQFVFQPGGGVHGVPRIESSILWGNQDAQFSQGPASTVGYSIVQFGHPGAGNLDVDPLFVAPFSGDYRLQPGSPAIDGPAGSPSSS